MNYYVLFYHVVEDYVSARAPYREEHLRLAQESRRRNELVMAGALAEPTDQALLVFRAASKTIVERFVQDDPYVKNGLVARWEIRPWTVVIE